MSRRFVLLLVLLFSYSVLAQNAPATPATSPSQSAQIHRELGIPPAPIQVAEATASPPAPATATLAVQPAILVEPAAPASHRTVLDKKFWLLAALTTALTTTDIEFTQHCLHTGQCVEADPFMPHSRAGMYATTYPVNAALFYWSFRRRQSAKRLWWLAPVIDIGSHSVGTWSGARFLQ